MTRLPATALGAPARRSGALRLLLGLAAAALLAALAACGGSASTQTVQTERYKVQLTLDDLRVGARTATIEISDVAGNPVAAEAVVVAPTMIAMGMASPEMAAQMIAPGRYEARGAFFSMLGEWEFDVRVSAGGSEDVARFKLQVVE